MTHEQVRVISTAENTKKTASSSAHKQNNNTMSIKYVIRVSNKVIEPAEYNLKHINVVYSH